MADIRDYYVSYRTDGMDRPYAHVYADDLTKKYYSELPTIEEASNFLGEYLEYVNLNACYNNCENMIAAPGFKDININQYNGTGVFNNCAALIIPPRLYNFPVYDNLNNYFQYCEGITQAAVIPNISGSATQLYRNCISLTAPVSIPPNIGIINRIYEGCQNMSGEFIVRRNKTTGITDALKGTTKDLVIYGDRTTCEAFAATANNGNAHWSAWYDPTPAVTDRGQGSYTTADDITRMVRNGALAVSSYAPGRMVYRQGDIVRADEWEALVEAAQTIDPTVTLSTHYTNLNKIEKAFDDAL